MKFWYRVFVLCVFVLLIGIGGVIGYRLTVTNADIDEHILSEEEKIIIEDNLDKEAVNIYSDDEVESVSTKTYDIEVIYIDYYTLCDEEVTSSDFCYGTKLEEVKKQEKEKQEREKITYDILEESKERIVFKRVIDTYCPNHFKIILEEEKINIYNKINEEKYEIYKTLDVPIETLRKEVVDELTGGILINSKDQLNIILEDIES